MKKTFTFLALVVCISAKTQIINTYAGIGSAGYSGNGGAATAAELNRTTAVALDAAGNLYIADRDNHMIRKVTASTGIISLVAGSSTGLSGYSGDNGPATAAMLNTPTGVALDASGNVYIADQGNFRVRKIDAGTGIITTFAGTGAQGYAGDNGAAISAKFDNPTAISIDASGNIYIADENNSVIRKVTASTGIITTVAGDGTSWHGSDGIAATSTELYYPTDVAVDASNNIYIADNFNKRIRKVTASTGIISTIAGNGTSGYTGDGGPATSAQVRGSNIVIDGAGNVFIADLPNFVIRKVDAATGIITTVVGGGTGGLGDGGSATAAQLFSPMGLALDASGNLYIADGNRIRVVTNMGTAMGIENNASTKNISMYPNPSAGIFNLISKEEIQSVKVYNLQGKLVLNKEVNALKTSIDLTENTPGLYFYQMIDKKNQVSSGKLMLK